MTSGAQCLFQTAADAGVSVCFANPGTTEMPLVAALDLVPDVRAVLGLFEGVCTGAADGYGRMTGRPALTLLHLGPGFANGIANLHNARRARSEKINHERSPENEVPQPQQTGKTGKPSQNHHQQESAHHCGQNNLRFQPIDKYQRHNQIPGYQQGHPKPPKDGHFEDPPIQIDKASSQYFNYIHDYLLIFK